MLWNLLCVYNFYCTYSPLPFLPHEWLWRRGWTSFLYTPIKLNRKKTPSKYATFSFQIRCIYCNKNALLWYYVSVNAPFPPAFKHRADVPKSIISSAQRKQENRDWWIGHFKLLSPFYTSPSGRHIFCYFRQQEKMLSCLRKVIWKTQKCLQPSFILSDQETVVCD